MRSRPGWYVLSMLILLLAVPQRTVQADDVSPQNLVTIELLGQIDTPGDAQAVRVAGNLVYVADGSGGLRIIDVSNPASPVPRGVYTSTLPVEDVTVVGSLAYLATPNGLQVVDVHLPDAPVLLGAAAGFATASVDISGTLAYVTAGPCYAIVDTANPANPQVLDACVGPPEIAAGQVAVEDGQVFWTWHDALAAPPLTGIGTAQAGFPITVYSFSSFSQSSSPADFFDGLHVAGGLIYVAAGQAGLQLFSLSSGQSLVPRGSVDTTGQAERVDVLQHLAVVADGSDGIQVIDVSDPDNPHWRCGYDSPGTAEDVAITGDPAERTNTYLAYLADGDHGLAVFRITEDPTAVQLADLEAGVPGSLPDVLLLAGLLALAGLLLVPGLYRVARRDWQSVRPGPPAPPSW